MQNNEDMSDNSPESLDAIDAIEKKLKLNIINRDFNLERLEHELKNQKNESIIFLWAKIVSFMLAVAFACSLFFIFVLGFSQFFDTKAYATEDSWHILVLFGGMLIIIFSTIALMLKASFKLNPATSPTEEENQPLQILQRVKELIDKLADGKKE